MKVAINCSTEAEYKECTRLFLGDMADTVKFHWSIVNPFMVIAPNQPVIFQTHYFCKSAAFEIITAEEFLRDNKAPVEAWEINVEAMPIPSAMFWPFNENDLVAEVVPSLEVRGDSTVQQQDYSPDPPNTYKTIDFNPEMTQIFTSTTEIYPLPDEVTDNDMKLAHTLLDELLQAAKTKTPPRVGVWTKLERIILGPYPYPDRQAK